MPKHILPFALLSLLACQQPSATLPVVTAAPATAEVVLSTVDRTVDHSRPGLSLSASERNFLEKYNLASLIAKEPDDHEIMNGFYGPDHYRIEFAMLKVRQDSANPVHYFVQGKNRYKQVVTPFSGEITLTHLSDQPDMVVPKGENKKEWSNHIAEQNQLSAYAALGTFTLTEDAAHKGAGTFSGDVLIEFLVTEEGELQAFCRNPLANSRGGEVLFDGKWTNPETRQQKAVLWVSNIMSFRQDIFEKFTIGERDPDFNPKYAKLGWNTYWQNDEWWADAGATAAAVAPTQETEVASTDSL